MSLLFSSLLEGVDVGLIPILLGRGLSPLRSTARQTHLALGWGRLPRAGNPPCERVYARPNCGHLPEESDECSVVTALIAAGPEPMEQGRTP